MGEGVLTLTLVIDIDSDPISGRLRDDGNGETRTFAGWLQLAAALEAALASTPET